jgi:hypothetical protein
VQRITRLRGVLTLENPREGREVGCLTLLLSIPGFRSQVTAPSKALFMFQCLATQTVDDTFSLTSTTEIKQANRSRTTTQAEPRKRQ